MSRSQSQPQPQKLNLPPGAEATPWVLHPAFMAPAIIPFHESKAEIRLLLGGNGTAKTTEGSWEATCFSTGYNPIRNESYPVPNEGWAVCLRLKDQGPVLREALWRMLPHLVGKDGQLRPGWRYYKQDAMLEIKKGVPGAGSIIRLKQQEEGSESFFGGRPLWIWIDEEKAGVVGERNFNQIMARRTPGQKLHIFVTMTPEHGYSWTYRRMVDQESESLIPKVEVFHISKYDCPWISKEEIEAEADRYPLYEREARIYGRFNPMGTHPFFSPRLLLKAMEAAPKGHSVEFEDGKPVARDSGVGTILREKESGHEYLGAWDPSSGVGGDPSVFVVLDRHDLAEVFHASSNQMDPDLFALKVVLPSAQYFNTAKLAVEINGESGGAAIGAVRGYENLYYAKVWDKATAQQTDRLGWRTTDSSMGGGTRSRIFDALTRALRECKWSPSYDLLQEMGHVVVTKTERGSRPDHPDGLHDDHVVAAGIALAIHYEEPVYDWPPIGRLAVRWQGREPAGALIP